MMLFDNLPNDPEDAQQRWFITWPNIDASAMCGLAGHLRCGARQQTAAAVQAGQLKNTLALGLCKCVTSARAEIKEKVVWPKTFAPLSDWLYEIKKEHLC